MEFETIIGATQANFTLSGDNNIDVHPVFAFDPSGASSPDYGTVTIQGITYPTQLWAENEHLTVKFELNHEYDNGGRVDIHARLFPINDNAGTVNFEFQYFVQRSDGTSAAGETLSLGTTIEANDKTNNIGRYMSALLDTTNRVSGDMIIGTFKRVAGTYGSDVSVSEIGMHIAVGATGDNFGG